MATDDPFDDPGWKAYVTHVQSELVPMLDKSAMTISLAPKDPSKVDVKFAVELGLSIMLDKPIIVIIDGDGVLPPMLEKIAAVVIRGSVSDPATTVQLAAAISVIGLDLEEEEDDGQPHP